LKLYVFWQYVPGFRPCNNAHDVENAFYLEGYAFLQMRLLV
jgi:hypothetical protein